MVEMTNSAMTNERIMARLNITWNGQNGDLLDHVPYDVDDNTIKSWAEEAVRTGSVPGISAGVPNFSDYVVDRFASTEDRPESRIMLRPKVTFGL